MTTQNPKLTLRLDLHGDNGTETVVLDFDNRQMFDRFWATMGIARREAHFEAERLWPSANPYGGRDE